MTAPPVDWKPSQFWHYPLHWYSHVMHCFEVVAYRHPKGSVANEALMIYTRLVGALHLNVEAPEAFAARLSADRIESGMVIS